MKTPEQLKGTIRSMAAQRNLRAQEVLQMYLFERILERLAISQYNKNFILKGGLLISSMIGIGERTTMDMDTTVRGIRMEEDDIVRMIREILMSDVGDGISFEYESIEPIREEDAYHNFRVHLRAKYGKIDAPMKIDVTTGDADTRSRRKTGTGVIIFVCYKAPMASVTDMAMMRFTGPETAARAAESTTKTMISSCGQGRDQTMPQ